MSRSSRKKSKSPDRAWLYENYVTAFKGQRTLGLRSPTGECSRMFQYYRKKLGPWLAQYPKNGKVADLGCGSGLMLDVLKDFGFRDLQGIDLSSEQAALARRNHPKVENGDLLEFLQKNKSCFSLLVCFDVIEHLRRDELISFFRLSQRALLPGGGLILQTPNGDSPLAGQVIYGDLTHETILTPTSLSHALLGAGFSRLQFQEHEPDRSRPVGAARWLVWRILRLAYACLHLVETGSTPGPVYTRVFRAHARKNF